VFLKVRNCAQQRVKAHRDAAARVRAPARDRAAGAATGKAWIGVARAAGGAAVAAVAEGTARPPSTSTASFRRTIWPKCLRRRALARATGYSNSPPAGRRGFRRREHSSPLGSRIHCPFRVGGFLSFSSNMTRSLNILQFAPRSMNMHTFDFWPMGPLGGGGLVPPPYYAVFQETGANTLLLSFLTPPIDKHHSRGYAFGSCWNPRNSPGGAPVWEDTL
jgi:hypothetical protein